MLPKSLPPPVQVLLLKTAGGLPGRTKRQEIESYVPEGSIFAQTRETTCFAPPLSTVRTVRNLITNDKNLGPIRKRRAACHLEGLPGVSAILTADPIYRIL